MKNKVNSEIARLKSALPAWHFTLYGKVIEGFSAFVACYPPDRATMVCEREGSENHAAVQNLGFTVQSVCGPFFTIRID